MLKNHLIIMPFNLPWDWSADYQRQSCLILNKQNFIVAYMHQHAHFFLKKRKYKYPKVKNIHFFTPKYIIPFKRFKFIEELNQSININYIKYRFGLKKQTILWIFNIDFHNFPLFNRKIISLYDCVDYVWSRGKKENSNVQKLEKKLITNVNSFFVNSESLFNKHKNYRVPNMIVPQGFDLNSFSGYISNKKIIRINKPTIGFVGAINHRIHFKLLITLIKRNPQWQFIFWGRVQELEVKDFRKSIETLSSLNKNSNVLLGMSKSRKEIPAIIKQFDVCIIPYKISLDFNKYCYPMKIFEYFYCGKPVVSTPINELKRFSEFVRIGKSVYEWECIIKELLSKPWPQDYIFQQKKLAKINSWENKINAILKII